jgi:hypothetical protein
VTVWGVEHTCTALNMQRPDPVALEIRYATGKTLIASNFIFVNFCSGFLSTFFLNKVMEMLWNKISYI